MKFFITFCATAFLLTAIGTVFLVLPVINNELTRHQESSINTEIKTVAKQFEQYTLTHAKALQDIADSIHVINAAMQEDGKNINLMSLLSSSKLLGQRTEFSLFDINGNALYNTPKANTAIYNTNEPWFENLLDSISYVEANIVNVDKQEILLISVPVLYRKFPEGVLTAHIPLNLYDIFGEETLKQNRAIRLTQNKISISSTQLHIKKPQEINYIIDAWNISVNYIYDIAKSKTTQSSIINKTITGLSISLLLAFCVFAAFGKKIAMKPYVQLAKLRDKLEQISGESSRISQFPKNNPNPLMQIDYTGHILYSNPAALKIENTSLAEGSLEKHPLLRNILEVANTVAESQLPFIRTVDVQGKTYQQTITPVSSDSSLQPTLFIYSHNITAIKEVESKLRFAKDKAEDASKAKTEFLSSIGQELRTPMDGIISLVQIISTDATMSYKSKQMVQTVKNSVLELLATLNDLLDISMIEAGELTVEPVCFDLRKAFDELITLYKPNAAEHKLKLDLVINQDVPALVKGDMNKLQHVLRNLITNAIKFTDEGSITVSVALQTEYSKPEIVVSVKDTGIGIQENKLDTIFDKFTRADSNSIQKYSGTGLGLTICKELVNMMDGQIGVENTGEDGSIFYFSFPLNAPDTTEIPVNINIKSPQGERVVTATTVSLTKHESRDNKTEVSKPVNMSEFSISTDGNIEKERAFFDDFLDLSEPSLKELKEAYKQNDFIKWKVNAHKIKDAAIHLHAEKLAKICSTAEDAFELGSNAKEQLIQEIQTEFIRVKEYINTRLTH